MGVVNARRPWEHEGSRQGSRGLPRPVGVNTHITPEVSIYLISTRGVDRLSYNRRSIYLRGVTPLIINRAKMKLFRPALRQKNLQRE